jgi:hypothetical protein
VKLNFLENTQQEKHFSKMKIRSLSKWSCLQRLFFSKVSGDSRKRHKGYLCYLGNATSDVTSDSAPSTDPRTVVNQQLPLRPVEDEMVAPQVTIFRPCTPLTDISTAPDVSPFFSLSFEEKEAFGAVSVRS